MQLFFIKGTAAFHVQPQDSVSPYRSISSSFTTELELITIKFLMHCILFAVFCGVSQVNGLISLNLLPTGLIYMLYNKLALNMNYRKYNCLYIARLC